MDSPLQPAREQKISLDQISTRWSQIHDPTQFLVRYVVAIRRYLEFLIKNQHDVEEVVQDFLTRAIERGFKQARPERGRFRNYLKKSLRNAALNHLRKKKAVQPGAAMLEQLSAPADSPSADQEWLAGWRQCVLDKAWRALNGHQHRTPGNLFYTVLRLAAEHPREDSKTLAVMTGAQLGRSIEPEAFRKQLSRARHLFANLLVQEVSRTLEKPSAEQVEEELIELGLMEYVRDFLPDDWRARHGRTDA